MDKNIQETKEILTYYLNIVEFAPGVYGIKPATLYYFKKLPSQVTPEEAAFLAFLLPNPKKYHQSFARKQLTPFATKMVHRILHKMLQGKKINEAQFAAADNSVSKMFHGGVTTPVADTSVEGVAAPNDADDEKFLDATPEDAPLPQEFTTEYQE
jgi:membrane peptidoglycan carboxypeptidase